MTNKPGESSPSEPQVSTKDLLKDENKKKEAIDGIRKSTTKDITELDPRKRAEAISKLPSDKKIALSQDWMKKANFTESMTQKAYAKLGLNKDSKPEEIIKAVSKYQEDNKLAAPGKGDGILGWKTLESLDAAISKDDTATDSKEDKKNNVATADDKIQGFDRASFHEKKNSEQAQQRANDVLAQQRGVKRMLNESQRQTIESTTSRVEKEENIEEKTKNQEIKIGDFVVKEGEWTKGKAIPGRNRGEKNIQEQLTKYGDSVISYKNGQYSVAQIDKAGNVGDFNKQDYKDLPLEFQQKNNQNIAKDIVSRFGNLEDRELFAPNVKISALKLGDLGRGTEIDGTITPEAVERIKFLQEKLEPVIAANPEMKDITLGEYTQFSENPDLFVSSRFMKERSGKAGLRNKQGFIDPQKYGVPSKYEYSIVSGGASVKKPKEGANLDTIMIAGKDGKYESQKSWMERVQVKPDTEYQVYGMADMRFKKTPEGDIMIYKSGEEKSPKSRYLVGEKRWEEGTQSV